MKIERIIFGVIIVLSMGVYAYAESCSTAGATQYKYTASGCSYSTSTRTCCSKKTWSDWDKECQVQKVCNEGDDARKDFYLTYEDEYAECVIDKYSGTYEDPCSYGGW